MALKEVQVQLATRAVRDFLDHLVFRVLMVSRVIPDRREILVQLEILDRLDLPVHRDLLVSRVIRELQDL